MSVIVVIAASLGWLMLIYKILTSIPDWIRKWRWKKKIKEAERTAYKP